MYFKIGAITLIIYGVIFFILYMAFRKDILKWMKLKKLFMFPAKMKNYKYGYQAQITEGVIDVRNQAFIILGAVGAILWIFIYPAVLGFFLAYLYYVEYWKENARKWIQIKQILKSK